LPPERDQAPDAHVVVDDEDRFPDVPASVITGRPRSGRPTGG
jgi:hypothetical protein